MTKKRENPWKEYQREKEKIRRTNPTSAEYEKKIKKVVEKLKI